MNKSINNLQDIFLNNARKNKTQITIHLTNGFQMKGIVQGFDSYTVVIDNGPYQQLIYKHAISTITPEIPLLFQ